MKQNKLEDIQSKQAHDEKYAQERNRQKRKYWLLWIRFSRISQKKYFFKEFEDYKPCLDERRLQ